MQGDCHILIWIPTKIGNVCTVLKRCKLRWQWHVLWKGKWAINHYEAVCKIVRQTNENLERLWRKTARYNNWMNDEIAIGRGVQKLNKKLFRADGGCSWLQSTTWIFNYHSRHLYWQVKWKGLGVNDHWQQMKGIMTANCLVASGATGSMTKSP